MSLVAQCELLGLARHRVVLPRGPGIGAESGVDAADRRGVYGASVLRQPAVDDGGLAAGRVSDQPQAGDPVDGGTGVAGDLPEAGDLATPSQPSSLPLPAARDGGHGAGSRLEYRYHLHPSDRRVCVPGGEYPDWYSRKVLAWRLSNALETTFCLDCLDEALARRQPVIFNTDQGTQFTSTAFTGRLAVAGIQISMDGRGRAHDNIFVKRLWRSVKYEEVYPNAYDTLDQAYHGLDRYFEFYNHQRPHQALNYQTPAEVYADSLTLSL